MKPLVIILAIACVALGFGWYKSGDGATQQTDALLKQTETLSNQVAEVRTRLALEQGTAAQVQSNLHFIAQQRTGQLLNTSNRLIQTHLLLKAAQADAQQAQTDLQTKAAHIAVLETQQEDFRHRLAALTPLQRQIADAREKLADATADRDNLQTEIGRLQVERAELAAKLNDIPALRLQLSKAEDEAETRLRLAKAGPNAKAGKKARLELLEDGTVRPVFTADTQARK